MAESIWGSYQRFEFQELSLTLRLSDYVYKVGVGDTIFERIGYDRYLDPDHERKPFYGHSGATHIDGFSFQPYLFFWHLQNLAYEDAKKLKAISIRSQSSGIPVRLFDGLFLLEEEWPRRRAKVGLDADVNQFGLVEFFPVFDVWLHLENKERSQDQGRQSLKMTGYEFDPDLPVSPSLVVAA